MSLLYIMSLDYIRIDIFSITRFIYHTHYGILWKKQFTEVIILKMASAIISTKAYMRLWACALKRKTTVLNQHRVIGRSTGFITSFDFSDFGIQ